jgi:reverse gyrase
MVIYLNKPTDKLIANVNDDLESMVRFNRKADYAAKKVGDGFLIFIVLPSIDEAAGIIYNIVEENKIKVNALTEKSLAKIKK